MTHISIAGKGGTGKTTFSALLTRWLVEHDKTPVLAVDADPNANLGEAMGVEPKASISEAVARAKSKQDVPSGMTTNVFIEYELARALTESSGFDLLVMGGPDGPGCYCFPNEMLRHYLEELSKNYPYLVMDNEAGMEHLSRRVAREVDVLIITSDPTHRGIRSAARIAKIAESMKVVRGKSCLVLSMSQNGSAEGLGEAIASTGLELVGTVPFDKEIQERDLNGQPLLGVSPDSPAYKGVSAIAERLGI